MAVTTRNPVRAALSAGVPRVLFLLGLVEVAALVVNLIAYPDAPALLGKIPLIWRITFGLLTGPAMLLVGGLILWRAECNRVGLSLVLASLGLISGQFSLSWSPVLSTLGTEMIILYAASIAIPALFYLLLIFPTGQVYPHQLAKWVIVYAVLKFLGGLLEIMGSQDHVGIFPLHANPLFVSILVPYQKLISSTIGIHGYILQVGLVIGLGSMLLRYRNASRQQRQQIKWVIWAMLLLMLAVLIDATTLLGRPVRSIETDFPVFLFVLIAFTQLFLVASIGIGIFRYQWFNIDRMLNRTLVYGLLTALVIAVYILIVGSLSELIQGSGNLMVSLIATGLVAVLFQPLRDWMQGLVNRLMYGKRNDPYAVLSDLNQRLQNTLSPQAVLPMVVETIATALKIPYAAIFVIHGEGYQPAAEFGLQPPPRSNLIPVSGGRDQPLSPQDTLVFPLVYQKAAIGKLVLAARKPGESFTATDKHILSDIANQVGVLTYTVQLTNDLQRSRERLVHLREEERRRLRRDLHDGLGTQLAGLSYNVNAARNTLRGSPDQTDELLKTVNTQVQTALADLRRLVYDLRPPALDQLGLVSAIREQIVRFSWPDGLQVTIDAPDNLPDLPAAVEVAAYRIVLEGLTNVCRHAQAKNCLVSLQVAKNVFHQETLHIQIWDDGRGLPEAFPSGIGLLSMQERTAELGGHFSIGSDKGQGTTLRANLPVTLPNPEVG